MIVNSKYWPKIKRTIPKHVFNSLLIFYYKFNSIIYSGKQVYCPICDKKFEKFKKNNTCPACGAGSWHKAMWLFLSRRTNILTNNQLDLLHFAPEYCFYYKFKKMSHINYLSGDLNSPRAMEHIDMTNIDFPDNYFDVLLSNHVLEHVDNDIKAMRELYRVQKNDGWSVHLVPIDYTRRDTFEDQSINTPELRQKIYGHYDHKRIYGTDYKNRLESVGFTVEIIMIEDFASEDEMCQMGLKKGFEIYFCRK
jgi:SAM-dependent methyltransferase